MKLSGCLFWIAFAIFLFLIIPSACSVPIVSDMAETSRERAAAERADAEAMAAMAEAEKIEADALKTAADANAYTIRRYTDAGVNAIETDRKQAHKMVWLSEIMGNWIAWLGLLCALPLNLTCLATVFILYHRRKSQPKTPYQ